MEVSYNDSDNGDQAYRAEVEFISESEWRTELTALCGDFQIEVPKGETNHDADVALAKVRAVYVNQTKSTLATTKVENLVDDATVKAVLGTTKQFTAESAKGLTQQLKPYVEGPEKSGNPKMAYWPLIRVVRIYTKADVLSTGASIVDLVCWPRSLPIF